MRRKGDFMKKLLNNKLFLILALYLFFLFINIKPSFAAQEGFYDLYVTSEKYNKNFIDNYIEVEQSPFEALKEVVDYFKENYPDSFAISSNNLPKYAMLIKLEGSDSREDAITSDYLFVYSSKPMFMYDSTNTLNQTNAAVLIEAGSDFFTCTFKDGGVGFQNSSIVEFSGSNISLTPYASHKLYNGSYSVLSSNFDVLNVDGVNTVFQQPTLGKVTTLAPVMNKVEMTPVLEEIIMILPLIIVVVVSLVGLRKALKMLSQLLHRS